MMTFRVDPHQRDWAGRFWILLGWVLSGVGAGVTLFPAVMVVVLAGNGHFSGLDWLLFYWGLGSSAWQGAVWTMIWFARRGLDAPKRRMIFGVGVPLSLIGSLGVLAATQNSTSDSRLAWAGLAYLLIAALAVWATRRPATERSTAEQS
jgi:hypothetical protein